MIQDPAGLLGRAPELEPLCQDAKIRKAVEKGDPFKIYRAIFWARLLGRLRSQRPVMDALLRNRRLFVKPLKGNLFLGTLNSFGASLVGSSEPDPQDGTHIATHAIVALFAIPLLPLGAYVIRPAQGKGGRRAWTIFARVPLGSFAWGYNRLVALGVIALVAMGALGAFHAARFQDVHLVNGFAAPLTVTLGPKTQVVPAKGHLVIELPVGTHHGRAVSEAGEEIDQVDLTVQAPAGLLAWNLAGAAPVFRENLEYWSKPKDHPSGEAKPDVFCGQREISVKKVDDAFRDSPKTLKISSGTPMVLRTHVGIAPAEDPADLCINLLLAEHRAADALRVTMASARLTKWSQRDAERAVIFANMVGPEEGVRVAALARDARPDDVDVHREYQWAAQQAGRRDEVVKEYRARAEAHPDSAAAQYLYVRLLRGAEAREATEKLVARFPESADALRSAIYERWRAGRFAEAVAGWARLKKVDPAMAADLVEQEALSLVALGRPAEALQAIQAAFDAASQDNRDDPAELYATVAAGSGLPHPEALVAKLEAGDDYGERWVLRLRAGLPAAKSPPGDARAKMLRAVRSDPRSALQAAAKANDIRVLSRASWALLYGEALRLGSPAAKVLEEAPFVHPLDRAAFQKFVRGEPASIDDLNVEPDIRAAACFVRSRNAALPAAERKALVEQAQRDDTVHGAVTEAVRSWKL